MYKSTKLYQLKGFPKEVLEKYAERYYNEVVRQNFINKILDILVKKRTEGLLKSDVLSGCFFLVKSDVMKNIDYFDENTFLYYEENILATKIKKYEYNAYVSLDNIIYHNHSVSVDKSVNELNRYKLLKQSYSYG